MELHDILNIIFSLLTLSFLEIILGIDNLIFISISTAHLPKVKQKMARQFGLLFALVTRLLLLASVFLLTKLTYTLCVIYGLAISIRDVILLAGGVFLLYKGTVEVHNEVTLSTDGGKNFKPSSLFGVIVQIGILDIVFSLDSVMTAVGMTQEYWIMATAICIAIAAMVFLSEPLSAFVQENPTIKMLALSFIIMVGMVLVADGLHYHIPRGYLYFAITFSLFVEAMNMLARKRRGKIIN